jgi:hypothetical protein
MRELLLVAALAGSALPMTVNAADDRRIAGRKFFAEQVVPKLAANGCPMCHAVGYVRPNVIVYDDLLPYLAMGDAPEKSALIRKIANLRAFSPARPTHPGGQRCADLVSDPCKTILRWWAVEFGPHK